jgi:hypothetical protein
MSNTNEYLEKFFEEKEIPYKMFEIKHKGEVHLIDNDFIIELIKKAPAVEKKAIGNMLRKIDFLNGNVNHYLEHLANGYINQRY